MLRDKLSDAVKDAMKSGEKLKLSTLRMVQAAVKNAISKRAPARAAR